jgi:hypothetical protein
MPERSSWPPEATIARFGQEIDLLQKDRHGWIAAVQPVGRRPYGRCVNQDFCTERGTFPRTPRLGSALSQDLRLCKSGGNQMTLSTISHYRGGAIDEVVPLAQTLKAIYLKYGVGYRLSRFQTGLNEGDWFVIVTYADATAYEKAQAHFSQDPELQQVFIEIAKLAKRVSREMVIDLDL